MSTRGGQRLELRGNNFGVAGLVLEGYYTANPAKGWYCARDCVVTVANEKVECVTAPGIGKDMVWKLEKSTRDWLDGVEPPVHTAYASPLLNGISRTALGDGREFSTHGNQDVFLTGDHFGPRPDPSSTCAPSNPGSIFVEYKPTGVPLPQEMPCEIVRDHTQIKCSTVAGVSYGFVGR